jgi:hypothetical protein
MKFADLLIAAIRGSEIPLRFEPGAEEAVSKPVLELLRAWLEAHEPAEVETGFEKGRKTLIAELIAELDGNKDLPAE